MKSFNAEENYRNTRDAIGFIPRHRATQADYDRIGFKAGLEVHQQLMTERKLFCRCPAGRFHAHDDFDAEIVRHMRPTLSELGEYDGTALMEFKTRKEIIYRLKNESACTYDVDDTPPFPMDREALKIALEICVLAKLNIVGEVHITRKQYLDGSIPTGFQRTAILGVEGEIPLRNKTVRLIQLSIEEDSCREISDIGHTRVYKTDRLGMPLIETVTYPEMVNPDETREACNVIRFLNRSTGKVRTGIGAGREDVNVSCRGGTRVEIKGVAHTRWIPKLTHNEAFRQWALLHIRAQLQELVPNPATWKMTSLPLDPLRFAFDHDPLRDAKRRDVRIVGVNLPGFRGILSHFTQPGKVFANEISERLKVIACLEQPNLTHSEDLRQALSESDLKTLRADLGAGEADAQIVFWGPEADLRTALETIEERCRMAFAGVPNETRKSLPDGTTIFERVLPGADRMYPDTDSPPIPLANDLIEDLRGRVSVDLAERTRQLRAWGVPEDTYIYLFSKNLFPQVQRLSAELGQTPKRIGTFLGHRFKYLEGQGGQIPGFTCELLLALYRFLQQRGLAEELADTMLPVLRRYPRMDFESVLESIRFKPISREDILGKIPFLKRKYRRRRPDPEGRNETNWIMGQLRGLALGNIRLSELATVVRETPSGRDE